MKQHSLKLLEERVQCTEVHQLSQAMAANEQLLLEEQHALASAQQKKREMAAVAKVRVACSDVRWRDVLVCVLQQGLGWLTVANWCTRAVHQNLQHEIANFGKDRDRRVKAAKEKIAACKKQAETAKKALKAKQATLQVCRGSLA